MKWFQLESDTPHDPKIVAVVRALGNEGFGALVALWCHVARHGSLPGRGIDSRGAPFPVEDLIAATGLPPDKFDQLLEVCTRTGHFRREVWQLHRGIWIPAMERRADRYTQRLRRSSQIPLDWSGASS